MKPDTIKSNGLRRWLRKSLLSKPLIETIKYEDGVIDLACGYGNYLELNPKATGVDIDNGCIEYLLSCGFNVLKGDITGRLDLPRKFDWAITYDVLEHLDAKDSKRLVVNICRILREGGRWLVAIPQERGFYSGSDAKGHVNFIRPSDIKDMVRGSFEIIRSYSYPLPRFIGKYWVHNKDILILRKL